MVLTFDGKSAVLHRESPREATRNAAQKRRGRRDQFSRSSVSSTARRSTRREAHGDGGRRLHGRAVRGAQRGEFPQLDARAADGQDCQRPGQDPGSRQCVLARLVELLSVSLEGEPPGSSRGDAPSGAARPGAHQAPGPARRPRRHATQPRGGGTRRVRRRGHNSPPHHPRGRVRLQAAHIFNSQESPELASSVWTRVRDIVDGTAHRGRIVDPACETVAHFSLDSRKPVDTFADYLPRYAPHLHYHHLAAHYPIGTGTIEAPRRHRARHRMDLAAAPVAPEPHPAAPHSSHRCCSSGLKSELLPPTQSSKASKLKITAANARTNMISRYLRWRILGLVATMTTLRGMNQRMTLTNNPTANAANMTAND